MTKNSKNKETVSRRISRNWHLATDTHEVVLTELEFAIIRVASAFDRWQSDCLAFCSGQRFSGADVATLHVIRMHDRPKSISEIARLLKRDDQSNLQYGIRKLSKAGLIEKSSGNNGGRKGVTYQVTDEGREVTETYATYRQELLLSMTKTIAEDATLEDVSKLMNHLSGLYDQAARVAATHLQG